MMFCEHRFLEVLGDNPLGTGEIAEKVGCDYRTAYIRLKQLLVDGKIRGKKMNRQAWMWWRDEPRMVQGVRAIS